ncbi:MAG: hypothetical protein LBI48_02030 [Burkholderiaceae bacterium]|nr:hypothetical protein [Burkholderiaceae bacterium]
MKNDSVFDFLYCDTQRIASFLSQFDDSGHLQQVIQRESATRSTDRKLKFGGDAKLSLIAAGASGNVEAERGTSDEGSEASDRVYDPLWANARTFLDYLDAAKLVVREVTSIRMGTFLLISGVLSVFDMSLLRKVWEDKPLADILKKYIAGTVSQPPNREQRRASRNHVQTSASPEIDIVFALLKLMPHAIAASIRSDDVSVWCSLASNGLVGSSSDILLKHGFRVAGTWNMLGIVDAFPETHASNFDNDAAGDALSLGTMGAMVHELGPKVRELLGRPGNAIGVTPLLIFREVPVAISQSSEQSKDTL